jgi:hypothetical protein
MSDRFYGTVTIGGQITQEQYARCLELLEPCLAMDDELNDEGSATFRECTEEDFEELVQYCAEQGIALMLQWEAKYDIGDYVEYWIDGNHQQFDTDSSGCIVVTIDDLEVSPFKFISDFIDMLSIPEFPELLIVETNQRVTRVPSRTFTDQKPKLAIAKDVLEFVCKTISDAETIGSVDRHGSRANAIANEAAEICRRCREALDLISNDKD